MYQAPPSRIPRILNESASVTLSAAGAGSVRIGPNNPLQIWHITRIAVYVAPASAIPIANVYIGTISPGGLVGGSFSGSNDSSDVDLTLWPGQFLTVDWSGADASAVATVSLYGEIRPR
jgi:hypothetical protein